MRILLLSDIHANIVALETVLADAPSYDAVWCLGDVVGYGPAPNECVARLRALNGLTLAGNHDLAVVGALPLDDFRDVARAALEWTIRNLSPENVEWLKTLDPARCLQDKDVTLVHASPRSPALEYINSAQTALENFPFFETSFCLFGHTHRPIAYHLRAQDRVLATSYLPEHRQYPLEPKLLLNPGSVGQPRDGDARAGYAILDLDSQLLSYHRIGYDVEATQHAMLSAGLPYFLVKRLAQGA